MARVTTKHSVQLGYARVRLERPGGPLVRDLMVRGVAVQAAAKQRLRQAPQRIDTGNLLNSIQVRTLRENGTLIVRVETRVRYAIYVHNGTRYMEANPFLKDGLRIGMQQFG
jgi:HK97 gp10 family phage protein